MGLRVFVSIFPLVVMGVGVIVFWKYYTISQEDLEKTIIELEKLET
jgi:Na+/melibiose symporter-like transporter